MISTTTATHEVPNKTALQSTLVPVLEQDCLLRQELAQLYKALAKNEPSPEKRDLYQTLAIRAERGILRPARRLKRYGKSVPVLQTSVWHWLKQQWLCRLNPDQALAWLQQVEDRNTQRYLEVLKTVLSSRSRLQNHRDNSREVARLRQAMFCPRSRYYGQPTPEQVTLNRALQDFANQVALTCALETGGKITPAEAMSRLDVLWHDIQTARMRHRLTQEETN
jgi:hypothetical protein